MTPSTMLDPMLPEFLPVRRLARETADTFTLFFDASGRGGFRFGPGQFNMLYAFGVGEVPISISGDPARPGELVHTIRAVGAVTRALQRAKKGTPVGVRGPFGSSWPVELGAGRDVVLVAGGIGLAPLKPAIHHLFNQRERFGKVVIVYGTRTPGDILFRKQLERWATRSDLELKITVDRGDPGWQGHTGVVTTLLPQVAFDVNNAIALLCGPEVMMRFAARELRKLGLPDERIFLSLERNMKCALAHCGRCQLGGTLICRDGPVYRRDRILSLMSIKEL
jgi:NAD(P)H-flavin reductase